MDDLVNLVIVVVGFILVIASLALPGLLGKRRSQPAQQSYNTQTSQDSSNRRALERVEESLVNLEETSRILFARLDTRGRMLIRLIEDAQVKTQQLKELVAQHGGGESS